MKRSRDCDLAEALRFLPFDGDETDVSPLSDKIVKAAKEHPRCQICHGVILKGERHRAKTERNNEEKTVMTFRFCNKCCRAMAHPDCFYAGRLIESRYAIGDARRSQERLPAPRPRPGLGGG
ncbi:MAG TPA: hypothetical protein PK677_11215 [Acidiphilium sp.]|nr:hypothetical protein [Acidiphilium sp.]